MLVALYSNHHHLPFYQGQKPLPQEVFDPEVHGKRVLTRHAETSWEQKQVVSEDWLWPILIGLHQINWPIMAHVSAFREYEDPHEWHYCHRVWVQITTLAEEKNEQGIPITVRPKSEGAEEVEILVKHLWGSDNGTHTPYEFVLLKGQQEAPPELRLPAFWRDFFMQKLRETKAELGEIHAAAVKEAAVNAELYSVIPDDTATASSVKEGLLNDIKNDDSSISW